MAGLYLTYRRVTDDSSHTTILFLINSSSEHSYGILQIVPFLDNFERISMYSSRVFIFLQNREIKMHRRNLPLSTISGDRPRYFCDLADKSIENEVIFILIMNIIGKNTQIDPISKIKNQTLPQYLTPYFFPPFH